MERLGSAGHVVYVVGGSVRDFLLKRPIKDFDLATDAGPDELVELFPDAIQVGREFGVIKVPFGQGAESQKPNPMIEIATFREDLEYLDHRHPSKVRFGGPEEDAARRDFTINALFYDPKTTRVLDCVGGIEDLRLKMVRAIGDPRARFKEDALRLLRAVRFATRLGFEIDRDTDLAIRERGPLLMKVSAERIRDELTLMLLGDRAAQAIALLSNNDLLARVLPEVERLRAVPESPALASSADGVGASVFQQTLRVFEALVSQNPGDGARSTELVWAALLHSVGKAEAHRKSGGKSFNGHELEGARIARGVCERLRFSRDSTERVVHLIEEQLKFSGVFQMREATLQRFVRAEGFPELLALHRAQAICSDGNLAPYEFCLSRYRELESGKATDARLIKGEDLVELGLKPGPRFSEILRDVEDLALEGRLRSKDEALEYVMRHYVL